MIPEAEHIAQAAKADYMLVREIDLSMRIDTGWVSAGRFRTLNDEEDPESIVQGRWLCNATETESEWDMKMAFMSKYEQFFAAAESCSQTVLMTYVMVAPMKMLSWKYEHKGVKKNE